MQNRIVTATIDEDVVAGKRLGRHIHHDPRSQKFPAAQASRIIDVKHESTGLPLVQGEHRCSTAHALCAALDSDPKLDTPLDEAAARHIYKTATELEGNTYDPARETGSSALMACKAARRLGLIDSYHHAFGLDHALRALVLQPVMTGIKWYSSFDSPHPDTGLVEISAGAEVRGGHEVLADEIDRGRELVWFWNSWGPEYGLNGRFCMSVETWGQLLQDQGDVTVPVR